MSENPYAAPKAAVVGAQLAHGETIELYSPTQVAAGAFLGGPVGLVYFLWANFRALGQAERERITLYCGAVFLLAAAIGIPLLPEKFPSAPINLLYIVVARLVADRFQMSKQAIRDSDRYGFHSNWRVVGLGLLCILASFLLVVGSALGIAYFGLLSVD
ncbi:hypothetical protein FCE95_08225 [Luteimonas gilva]|uniref:Uncharacterized protein n=1 Tax=Luteimonas gilva TaxID=2572684 RepID=A0A4U5JKP8_9GAMM|nr:hypothetical protein [Luteimonas gilva]TKR30122.1 hypothetical protein FCE95_08225 [Luteimonas gilva]